MAKPGGIDIDISEVALQRIKRGLTSAVDDAVGTKDLQALGARIQSIILLRTRRGYFLDGSGGKEKRRYQSESHKARRAALGLTTSHVTLFFGEGGLLEALVARGKASLGDPRIEIGYLPGISEQKALEIAGYMNDQGIGPKKITYPYVGLTDKETETAIDFLRKRTAKNLKKNL